MHNNILHLNNLKVLFIENQKEDKLLVEKEIAKGSTGITSKRVESEKSFRRQLENFKPDLIISKYSLPSFSSINALKILEEQNLNIPFIILTNSFQESEAVKCLDAGADDYVLIENINRLRTAVINTFHKRDYKNEKVEIEKLLYESEHKFTRLFRENMNVMMLYDAEKYNIIDVNKAAVDFYGWTREELLSKKISDINILDRSVLVKVLQRIVKNGKTKENFKHKIADGSVKDVEISACILTLNNKRIFYNIVYDITDKIEQENELKKYRAKLEELVEVRTNELSKANKELLIELKKRKTLEKKLEKSLVKEREISELKTKFISTVSHEFRTPLAILLSSSELLKHYLLNEKRSSKIDVHFKKIEDTINHLTKVLDDVLTINRVDREAIVNQPEHCVLSKLINSLKNEINSFLTQNHKLEIHIANNEEVLNIDPKLFRIAVINLLTNAVKYSPKGGRIVLQVKIEENKLYIDVSDKGIGISGNDLEFIFDAFYRGKNSTTILGTGLGLNLVKHVTELMGGTVSVDSELNKGSNFSLAIPIG